MGLPIDWSPYVREYKTVLDSGFQILDSSLCQWNLDSGFQSLVGFQIPWAVFRIPKSRIPDSTRKNFPGFRISQAKLSRIPESGIRYRGRDLPISSQADQTHVTRKGCKIIYQPKVTRDLSAGRVGVALQATVENKRLCMRNKILRSANDKWR